MLQVRLSSFRFIPTKGYTMIKYLGIFLIAGACFVGFAALAKPYGWVTTIQLPIVSYDHSAPNTVDVICPGKQWAVVNSMTPEHDVVRVHCAL